MSQIVRQLLTNETTQVQSIRFHWYCVFNVIMVPTILLFEEMYQDMITIFLSKILKRFKINAFSPKFHKTIIIVEYCSSITSEIVSNAFLFCDFEI